MTKAEFISLVAEKMELKKTEAEKAIKAVFDSIEEVLLSKDEYNQTGLGTFKVELKKAYKARNPRTGETINVPEQYKPKFVFSSGLKKKLKEIK